MVNIMKNYKIIYLISFFSGFLSLSQEILWMRIISFAGMSVPQTFSFTLALFLVGISIGAIIGKKICKLRENLQLSNIGIIFFIAALVDLLLIVEDGKLIIKPHKLEIEKLEEGRFRFIDTSKKE